MFWSGGLDVLGDRKAVLLVGINKRLGAGWEQCQLISTARCPFSSLWCTCVMNEQRYLFNQALPILKSLMHVCEPLACIGLGNCTAWWHHLLTCLQTMACLQLSPGTKRILKDAQRGAQRVELLCNPAGVVPYGSNSFISSTAHEPQQQQSSPSSSPVLHRQSHSCMLPNAAGDGSVHSREVQQPAPTAAGISSTNLSNSAAGGSQTQQQRLIHCGTNAEAAGCTFKPVITKMAAALKARPVADMSEGDRLRREAKLVRQLQSSWI
jgi:hypothetical protein